MSKKAATGSKRILLVEDNWELSNSLSRLLALEGYEVKALFDGFTAYCSLKDKAEHFGLLVIDLDIPIMNGLELIERAREMEYKGAIIVMSGFLNTENRVRCEQLKVDRLIHKPADFRQLLLALREVMDEETVAT
jgi:OmpR-family two-component system manganese-sensing response regulator